MGRQEIFSYSDAIRPNHAMGPTASRPCLDLSAMNATTNSRGGSAFFRYKGPIEFASAGLRERFADESQFWGRVLRSYHP